MNFRLNRKAQVGVVGLFTLLTSVFVFRDYVIDGQVDVHYLFHDKDLPGFSNWWGLLIIPVLTWICTIRINYRRSENSRSVFLRFASALLFAIVTTLVFSLGYDPAYFMLSTFIVSLFYPLYKSEFLLGFVVGSLFFVGAAIPTMFGVMLLGIYFCLYRLARMILGRFRTGKPDLQ